MSVQARTLAVVSLDEMRGIESEFGM
jgi:hypothetical protein